MNAQTVAKEEHQEKTWDVALPVYGLELRPFSFRQKWHVRKFEETIPQPT